MAKLYFINDVSHSLSVSLALLKDERRMKRGKTKTELIPPIQAISPCLKMVLYALNIPLSLKMRLRLESPAPFQRPGPGEHNIGEQSAYIVSFVCCGELKCVKLGTGVRIPSLGQPTVKKAI